MKFDLKIETFPIHWKEDSPKTFVKFSNKAWTQIVLHVNKTQIWIFIYLFASSKQKMFFFLP